jgi:hypothetical protein
MMIRMRGPRFLARRDLNGNLLGFGQFDVTLSCDEQLPPGTTRIGLGSNDPLIARSTASSQERAFVVRFKQATGEAS